jgi:hypothetical protein
LRATKGSAAIPLISTCYEIALSPGAPRNDITTQSLRRGILYLVDAGGHKGPFLVARQGLLSRFLSPMYAANLALIAQKYVPFRILHEVRHDKTKEENRFGRTRTV